MYDCVHLLKFIELDEKEMHVVCVSYNSMNPKPVPGDNLKVWGGEGGAIKRRRHMSPVAYGQLMFIYSKNHHNIVIILQLKINKVNK